MHFFKRALFSMTRQLGKTFILLAIIFILGNVISGAIAIQQGTNHAEGQIKERLGTATKVVPDTEAIYELDQEEIEEKQIRLEKIDVDLIHQIGELPYVNYYDYHVSLPFKSEQIDYYISETMKKRIEQEDKEPPTFNLIGVNYAPVIYLEDGEGELVDGRTFTEEEIEDGAYVAIMTQSVAEKNNLRVGDTFTLLNEVTSSTVRSKNGVTIIDVLDVWDVDMEVIGIYKPQFNAEELLKIASESYVDNEVNSMENTMYVPNELLLSEFELMWETSKELDENFNRFGTGSSIDYYFPEFYLHRADDAEAFKKEAIRLLPDFYKVVMATDEYEKVAGPVGTMSKLANYVFSIAIGATVFITGLVVLLFLRDRRHELGIYLSLGERRITIVSQVVMEVMIIAVIGITLSLFTGNVIAEQISKTMVETEEVENVYKGDVERSYFPTSVSTDEVVEAYDIQFVSVYIFAFYGIGLLTILLSTVIPLIYIVRLNPKQILM